MVLQEATYVQIVKPQRVDVLKKRERGRSEINRSNFLAGCVDTIRFVGWIFHQMLQMPRLNEKEWVQTLQEAGLDLHSCLQCQKQMIQALIRFHPLERHLGLRQNLMYLICFEIKLVY